MDNTKEKDKLSFEKALLALEGVVESLSSENTDLDKMIRLYEEGIRYLKLCQESLSEAEAKIRILNEKLEPPQETNNG